MTKEFFLTATVAVSAILLVIDLADKYFQHIPKRNEKFKLRSIIFLISIIIIYGVIQYVGLLLVPPSERLIEIIRHILPSLALFHPASQALPLFGWIMLGIIAFYISGFWDYTVHRFLSHSRSFFFTHEYHHLPNELFLALPGLSVRPFVVVAVLPATIATLFTLCFGLALFGYTSISIMPLIYLIIFIQTVILAATHSSFFVKQRWIHRFLKYIAITTPQDHEIHHTVDLRGNYGNFTILWDRILGTYIDPTKPENQNHKLGLSYDQDFLGTVTAGKFKFSKKFRDYFQIDWYCNID